ncbi:BnaA02g29940D [Brassica napus]|uniref:LYR motif-containing protein 2 n=2 Tax=Brassica TaxID=3705 RepID=A0A078I5F0_BRANA|nr:BnaA02g29940D [Brassica napus]
MREIQGETTLQICPHIYIKCIKHHISQSFILRARVLKLYRHALKIAHRAPPQFRGELKQSIRQEMEKNSECKDKQKIRYLISEGLERIKQLDEMLDMQGH